MIFLVKGRSELGDASFSHRLAVALDARPPRWPVDPATLDEWRESLSGWPVSGSDFFAERFIDLDKVAALVLFEHREEFPPPPRWQADTSQEVFSRWRDEYTGRVMTGKYLPELFGLVCRMIDSMDHPILEGLALGSTPQDTRLSQMIVFKYSRQPILKILLLQRTRHDSGALATPREAPQAIVNGRRHSQDALLGMIRRDESGDFSLAPELLAE